MEKVSYNFKGKFIRHYAYRLRMDSVNSSSPSLLKKDATFKVISAAVKANQSKPETKKRMQILKEKGVVVSSGHQPVKDKQAVSQDKDQAALGTMAVNTDRYDDYRTRAGSPRPRIQ